MAGQILSEAARDGKLDVLENLLRENPSVLADFRLASLAESLLHVATKSGQLSFVHELMKIDPGIATELNKDGYRALDIAVILGNLEMVNEILSSDKGLCLLKGKDQRTALHYAAIKGRTEIIDKLLHSCSDSIEEVTVHGENALHLAVKSYQFDAFSALVKWLQTLSKVQVVNRGDGDGNTVLHLAVSTKQYACIDLLLRENSITAATIELNARNTNALTALDLLDIQDSYDLKIRQKLDSAGAVTAPNSVSATTESLKHLKRTSKPKHDLLPQPSKNWFKYFKFQKQRDSPSETRNALLVVAALIATVCFQAGINPPSGILIQPPPPRPPNQTFRERPFIGPAEGSVLAAAAAIFGSHAESFLFLFANSLALTASTCIIIYLTAGFPFQRELHIALYGMMFSYGFGVSSIIKGIDKKKKAMAYVLVTVAFTLPFMQRWLPRWGKKAWKKWRKRGVRKTPLPIDN
ncbi:Ankyrin repeat-containing protein BDA1 [Sesamum angolense]|uniref:Ankyrin repeat-containing protein BDA1 n=1 Tax=Sesamum angolense TaxID=2727404 RepID=A0AAE1XGE3_9LAMI|nr:Ankyrin repeat-containing protein BDA1 [Sesamum angolense]